MVAMPALAADWSSGDGTGAGNYSRPTEATHSKRYNFFSSDEETTPTKNTNGGGARAQYPMKSCMNLNGATAFHQVSDGIAEPKVHLFDQSKLTLQWSDALPAGAGLSNLGNTCFLNSVLQCLSYTAPLAHHLTRDGHKRTCKANDFCMLCALQDHLVKCYKLRGNAFKPLQILQNLKSIARCLTWGQQEDAHEFLRYVVDSMQKSCLAGTNGLDRRSKETTFVHQVFGGYLRSQVKCLKCHHASNTYDPYLDLSVDIKECDNVEQALSRFIAPEMLDIENAYKCERCKVKVRAEKRFTIHRSSNVLTLHLKRFDMNRMLGAKISRHVRFPMVLNIRPYMSKTQGEPITYTLYGVLVHSGFSCNSGHYYCYVRAPNSNWYCMNDSTVTHSPMKTVMDAEAYILFYVRVKKGRQPNRNAPHTVTRSEMMNGSGDHGGQKRVIIGPQLPASSSSHNGGQSTSSQSKPLPPKYTVNPFAVKKPANGPLCSLSNGVVKLTNGSSDRRIITIGPRPSTANQKPKVMVPSLVPYHEMGSDDEENHAADESEKKPSDSKVTSNGPLHSPTKPSKLSLSEYTARQKRSPDTAAAPSSLTEASKLSNADDKPNIVTVEHAATVAKFTPRAVKIGTATGLIKEQKPPKVTTNGNSNSHNGSTTLPAESLLLPEKPQVCQKCSLARCYCNMINSSASSSSRKLSEKNSATGAMPENPALSNEQILDLSPEGPKQNGIEHSASTDYPVKDAAVPDAAPNNSELKPAVRPHNISTKDDKTTLKTPLSSGKNSPVNSLSSSRTSRSYRDRSYRSRSPPRGSRTPRKRSRSPRKQVVSPKRSRSPYKYRQYSRSPCRKTYGRKSRSPRRRRSPSPEYRRRSHDSRQRRSRSRNTKCFSKKDRHKRRDSRSRSPSRSRYYSKSPSPDRYRQIDRHNGYKHTYSDRNKSSNHKLKHSESSSRKRRSRSPDRDSPSKRRKRSTSAGRSKKSDKHSAESKPLLNGASDDDTNSYQWIEVTKDKLKPSSKDKSQTTWYDTSKSSEDTQDTPEKKSSVLKGLQKFSMFANKYIKKSH